MTGGKILGDHFRFVEEYKNGYLLYDHLLERYLTIEQSPLCNPNFYPGDWYAQICQGKLDLDVEQTPLTGIQMGNAITCITKCSLWDGVLWYYPTPRHSPMHANDCF